MCSRCWVGVLKGAATTSTIGTTTPPCSGAVRSDKESDPTPTHGQGWWGVVTHVHSRCKDSLQHSHTVTYCSRVDSPDL